MNSCIEINTEAINRDSILNGVYERAVNKFMPLAGNGVVFNDLVDYIKSQISWKKQCLYTHGLPLVLEVCRKVEEDFYAACEHLAPDAKNYRDLYYSIFEN